MRMLHYFLAGLLLLVPALFLTLLSGMRVWPFGRSGPETHLWIGLFTATLGVAVHTLMILFMIVTGRILKEAMRARPLGKEFLEELNRFFAQRRAYPLAILGAFSIVAAGVLGFSQRGFGLSPAVHMLVGLAAVVLNLWALLEETRALRRNQALVDRVANALDALDREREASGAPPLEDPLPDAASVSRWGLVVAVSAWFPYLYWGVVNWRGDFSRVSPHPWVEGSLLGLFVWWLGRREKRRASSS